MGERAASDIKQRFHLTAIPAAEQVRVEVSEGHMWIARLVEAFPGRMREIMLGKPTLEDVFIAKTGHHFTDQRFADQREQVA